MSQNRPLISIIITCYKEKKLLKDAVNSALNQNYENIEIIIVKDFSNCTETYNACKEFEENQRTQVIYNSSQIFASGSRNKGINKSNGEIIFCLDGDDYIDKNFILKTTKPLIIDEKIGFVYTDNFNVYDGHKVLYEKREFNISEVISRGFPGSGIVYRKKDYLRTNGYNTDLIGQEDWEFLVQLCGLNLVGKRIDEPLYYYRKKSDDESKHIISTIKYGFKTRLKIIESNEKTFKDNSRGVIIDLYKMNQELWIALHNSKNPKHNFFSLLKWLFGNKLIKFIKKIRSRFN
jgi:glycosyltransferase involved in cell wall biosynthesis